jgi:hypothetical protein
MAWAGAVLAKTWGLFVDDGLFALSILLWLAVVWLLPRLGFASGLAGAVFFAGLAALLVHSTLKPARRP